MLPNIISLLSAQYVTGVHVFSVPFGPALIKFDCF